MKKFSILLLSLSMVMVLPLTVLAANDLTVNGDITIDLTTTDTASSETITLSSGSVLTSINIESNYVDVSLDNGSDLTLTTDGSIYFDALTEQSGSGAAYPSCPSSSNSLNITSTGTAVVRVSIVAVDPACGTPSGSGGGGGSGPDGFLKKTSKTTSSQSTSSTNSFEDVDGHWAEDYIVDLFALGVVEGRSETNFSPNDNINRAEVVKVALLLFGFDLDVDQENVFLDLNMGDWFYEYVLAGYFNKLVQGYEDGTFGPALQISRAEALKILMIAKGVNTTTSELDFEDVDGHWAYAYISTAYNLGVVEGYEDGTFGPNKQITRAELVKIAYKINNLN
jgi:hypothetical protein